MPTCLADERRDVRGGLREVRTIAAFLKLYHIFSGRVDTKAIEELRTLDHFDVVSIVESRCCRVRAASGKSRRIVYGPCRRYEPLQVSASPPVYEPLSRLSYAAFRQFYSRIDYVMMPTQVLGLASHIHQKERAFGKSFRAPILPLAGVLKVACRHGKQYLMRVSSLRMFGVLRYRLLVKLHLRRLEYLVKPMLSIAIL